MTPGQAAIITETCGYKGAILLRTYDNFVNLANPSQTWMPTVDYKVELLPPGTEIKLTVEE